MRVTRIEDLPRFGDRDVVVVDAETTSWNDDTKALNPFQGHRAAGYAVATEDGSHAWYLPVRHHSSLDSENLPLEPVQRWLQDLLGCSTRTYSNHNIKFDGRFMHFDGVRIRARMQCTQVLARLVDCLRDKKEGGRGYSLDALLLDYTEVRKDRSVAAYLRSMGSKDFGTVPVNIMTRYAEADARGTALLRRRLLRDLPAMSERVWETEQALTPWLLCSEIAGVCVDRAHILETYVAVIRELISTLEKIRDIAGYEVTLSNAGITDLLCGHLGIQPRSYTAKGNPQWTAVALRSLGHPVGPLLAEATHLQHFSSTFCEGWLSRLGLDGRLHASFNQSGTATGRLSASDPNLEQVPVEAEPFVIVPPEYLLVYFDYSQMEYRFFGHYTADPAILAAYRQDPDTDFHALLARLLGVDRQFAKQLNFSFIYGMGERTLLRNLAAVLSIASAEGDPTTNERLRGLLMGSGIQTAGRAKALDVGEQKATAEKIYREYHRQFPSIRQFRHRVARAFRARGWIRNYFGRVYQLDSEHKGPNYLIQGSCADLFKAKTVEVCEATHASLGALPLILVHDSILWQVPAETAREFFIRCRAILEDVALRVPMYVKGGVSVRSWGQMVILPREVSPAAWAAALRESAGLRQRAWGV